VGAENYGRGKQMVTNLLANSFNFLEQRRGRELQLKTIVV
jgi:hypothetical protein